ncbi:MAG: FdtA/QdtA family cupin domain-containing protein [Flavobacteriales bacterium]|jgi:dTDP-4-dehydrorhamnose 3,5-epimerase-like enzyme|nr:FdtA/QdtA family cupin domain-containing protein [Flavobacteriales bacterium]
MFSVQDTKIIDLPKKIDPRGNLSFLESKEHIPFEIKRVYWIYDVPGGEERGGHAFKEQLEFIIVLSGSLDVVVFDGNEEKRYHLNRSYYGLFIPKGIWRRMENFSTNSLVVCLASTAFDTSDYIRNKQDYLRFKNER